MEYFEKGNMLAYLGKYEEAIKCFKKAEELKYKQK